MAWAVLAYCAGTTFFLSYKWLRFYGVNFHPDSMVYYAAARLAIVGKLAVLFDPDAMTDFVNSLFSTQLATVRLPFTPWLYPPIYLLAVVPLGMLPFSWFYGVLQLVNLAAAAGALGWCRGRIGWIGFAALATAPAAINNYIVGQNAFLSVALIVGGMRLLDSRPRTAGALLGALVYKPQYLLLAPVALAAMREWRALVALFASASVLGAVSATFFGLESWELWAREVLFPSAEFADRWFRFGPQWGFSAYSCAILWGASAPIAAAAQALCIVLAAVSVLVTFRAHTYWEGRAAILLCATALATPHLQPYDLILLCCALIFMFSRASSVGFMAGEATVLAIAWALPLIRPIDGVPGRFAPLVIAAVMAYAMRSILARVPGEHADDDGRGGLWRMRPPA